MLRRRLGGDRAFLSPLSRRLPPPPRAASAVAHRSPGRRSPDGPPTEPLDPMEPLEPDREAETTEPEYPLLPPLPLRLSSHSGRSSSSFSSWLLLSDADDAHWASGLVALVASSWRSSSSESLAGSYPDIGGGGGGV